jgi:hypothetical protein
MMTPQAEAVAFIDIFELMIRIASWRFRWYCCCNARATCRATEPQPPNDRKPHRRQT